MLYLLYSFINLFDRRKSLCGLDLIFMMVIKFSILSAEINRIAIHMTKY